MNYQKRVIILGGLFTVFLFLHSCKEDTVDTGVQLDPSPYTLAIGEFPPPPIAEDNPLTKQGVQLGRMLFYDNDLSKDGSLSCSSCHKQENAFTDKDKFSIGVHGLPGKRHAMATFNMAWNTNNFFWDGRANLLRDQVLMPIEDSLEMAETLENVIAKLRSRKMYRDQFTRAFGSENITSLKISLALEQFLNSVVSVDSKYDKFLRGEVNLTTSEQRGERLFSLEYNPAFPNKSGGDCFHCHSTKNFSSNLYRNNGLESDASLTDIGRENVTNKASDRGKMKTVSLRNIELTAPYMHDGRFSTLDEVLEHYNKNVKESSTLSPDMNYSRITGLMLDDQDKSDIIAFLKTLTDENLMTNPEYSNPF